jgi:hypothetical protein
MDYLNGELDDVRIYNKVLTDAEIEDLANAPFNKDQQIANESITEPFNAENHITHNIWSFPNPFVDITTIKFSVTETNPTNLTIYSSIGEKLVTLFDGLAEAGTLYSFKFDASKYPKGIYYYYFTSGDKIRVSKKMVLIR